MVFSSPRFLLFLCVVLAVLGLMSHRERKKRLLALASCFFYAAWDWRYLGLLLLVSVIDYVAAWQIVRQRSSGGRKWWLLVSVVSNLGILGFFKYFNFFVDNANELLALFDVRVSGLDILLPVGISFYTFKTLSYTIDVYRGELAPCRSWLDYATFITFFPELIAGPIVRASVFLPQLGTDIGPTLVRLREGASLFLLGLCKKMLIADRMAIIADTVFASPSVYDSVTVWCGVVAYAIQICCDFSGYSDMAIGTAKMIGYHLPENFNMPYAATSITEFWKRWHITLSQWLRDYLYIPLGGNRGGRWMMYRNLMLTMLLGGLWHGASWNFVLWGGIHGVALVVHKALKEANGRRALVPGWLGWLITLVLVLFTWVPFRATGFESTLTILGKMLLIGDAGGVAWRPTWLVFAVVLMVAGHLVGSRLIALNPGDWSRGIRNQLFRMLGLGVVEHELSGRFLVFQHARVLGWYLVFVLVVVLFLFAPMVTNPFIYFQF